MAKKTYVRRNTLIKKIVSLTVFLDALFLVLILASAVFLYYLNLNNTREENAIYQNQIVETTFMDIIDSVESDAHKLATDMDIINYLNYVNDGNPAIVNVADPDWEIYSNYLIQAESVMNYQKDGLYDLVYLATETECSSGPDGCGITYNGQLSFADWLLTQRPWYTSITGTNAILTDPYTDGLTGEYVISYVEKVFDGITLIGYVGIDIKLTNLATVLTDIQTNKIQDDNEVILFSNISNNPKVMYFSGDQYEDYYMQDAVNLPTIDAENSFGGQGINYILTSYNTNGVTFLDAFGHQFIAIYSDIESTGFTTVTLFYIDQGLQLEIMFLILLAAAGIAVVLIALLMNRTIKKSLLPIDDILETIEKIKNGDYQVHVNIKDNNEFKKIGDAINLMSEEIDRQVKITYETLAYDILTGLRNRASSTKELDATIFKSTKKSAVCLIQVDNLKNINVTKGQMIGDNLIKAIADELKNVLKTEKTLYSNGGNEFIYIKENVQSLESVEYTLNKLLVYFREPLVVKNIKTEVKFHIGVAVYPTDGVTLNDLIKKCDTALYKASEYGNKKIIFYNEKIARSVSYQAEISERLSQAIDKGQIYLKFQPLITNNSEIYGFEALARWNSPALGEIGPTVFIANAEESYLIIPIGTWILREACKKQVEIKKKFKQNFVMSVNVSPVQILQKDFTNIVRQIIKDTDIDPNYLTLEITESVFIEASVLLEDTIEELHKMGVKLSLDDFGTGYASLTYLRQINFDNLKIDKSFVDGIFTTEKDHRIIGTIVNLVHNLDMKVIAEGVETRKQYEYLKQIYTDVFQGYIFSKPLIIEDLYAYIKKFNDVPKNKRADVYAKLNEPG